ncbi:MAG: endonuclease/exonuclease/phosphatase family protein [Clostridia bacterium]|nr:endonuclease/exonuclease/phosphatase family protein [Clostridia bacterium]
MNIKILCQNMKYAACKKSEDPERQSSVRRHRFVKLMEKYDPDIVGMQEVDELWKSMLREDFREEYDMYYLYRGSLKGSNEAEPVMWKKDKFEKVEEGSFWLSETPDTPYPPGFGQYYPRICNWVRLKEKESGKIIRIGSTHFGFYDDIEQIKVIRKLFERECEIAGEEPYIFMGDFNIGYLEEKYNTLADTEAYYDLRPAAEAAAKEGKCELGDIRAGTNNGFVHPDGKRVIDYIMGGSHTPIEIQKFGYCYERPAVPEKGINEGFVSDHFAIFAQVEV